MILLTIAWVPKSYKHQFSKLTMRLTLFMHCYITHTRGQEIESAILDKKLDFLNGQKNIIKQIMCKNKRI